MADYSRYKMSFGEAKSTIDDIDNMNDKEFNDLIHHWSCFEVEENNYSEIYSNARDEVVKVFKSTLVDTKNRINYELDLKVGIKLYEILNPSNGFTVVLANDDDIWRYISVRVMPDLTFIRYPNQQADVEIIEEHISGLSYANGIKPEKGSLRLKKKRFYAHTRRIWLKTLWWYIHLGWQGDAETTYNVLKNNGTNIISHFIERPGRGYREELFRNMLYAYSQLPEQRDKVFRAAAKLNLAKCVSVEPTLTLGGEEEYSHQLFNEVYIKENRYDDAEEINS